MKSTRYTYTDFARLDQAQRQEILRTFVIAENISDQVQQVAFLSEVFRSDPVPDIRELAQERLRQLGHDETERLKSSDQKLAELGGASGHVYERNELLNKSPFLCSPKSSGAFLSGKMGRLVPDGMSPTRSLLSVGIFTVVVGAIVAFLAVYSHSIPIALALVLGLFIIVADVVMVIVYLIGLPGYHQKRARYARLSDNGKLLLGRVVNTKLEVDAAKKEAFSYTLSYGFQTPEGKFMTGNRGVTRKQGQQVAPGTSVAVLYASDTDYEIL